ncbi:MAG: hypothetical protein ACLUJG_18340 [Lawsonibacter sp.]
MELAPVRRPSGREQAFAVVSVRDWPGTEELPQELAALCDHLRRTYGMEILFLLMQPKHDRNGHRSGARRPWRSPPISWIRPPPPGS